MSDWKSSFEEFYLARPVKCGFEYKREWIAESHITEGMNQRGAEGWEAFYVSPRAPGDPQHVVWFKREVRIVDVDPANKDSEEVPPAS